MFIYSRLNWNIGNQAEVSASLSPLFLCVCALLFCFLCAYWLSVHISCLFLPTFYVSPKRFSSWPPLRYAWLLTYSVQPLNHLSLETLHLRALSCLHINLKTVVPFLFFSGALTLQRSTWLMQSAGLDRKTSSVCGDEWFLPPLG